jgi:hypothetical protein
MKRFADGRAAPFPGVVSGGCGGAMEASRDAMEPKGSRSGVRLAVHSLPLPLGTRLERLLNLETPRILYRLTRSPQFEDIIAK